MKATFNHVRPLTDLEKDLDNHYTNSNSFMGWLLTLGTEEFREIVELYDPASEGVSSENIVIPVIQAYEGCPQHGQVINESVFEEEFNKAITSVMLVTLIREGILDYKVADNDDDWTFTIKKGVKIDESLRNRVAKVWERYSA